MPVLKAFCRESYSPPEAVYQHLKALGMDLVTLTDHDSIEGSAALGRHPDFFTSEEVTCVMPSGTELHVGVYDITERQHLEIQRRRRDLPALLAYLKEQDLFYAVNHAFSSLTGHRERRDFDWFESSFPAFEVLNGHLLPRANHCAEVMAWRGGKAALGGSDAHTVRSAGTAYTRVHGARSKKEFLKGLRAGQARAYGSSGTYWKLTLDIWLIVAGMFVERPATFLLSPLALAVPAATLLNYWHEWQFARKWGEAVGSLAAGPRRGHNLGSRSTRITQVQSEEAPA